MSYTTRIDNESIKQLSTARHIVRAGIESFLEAQRNIDHASARSDHPAAKEFEKLEPVIFSAIRLQQYARANEMLEQVEQQWQSEAALCDGIQTIRSIMCKMHN